MRNLSDLLGRFRNISDPRRDKERIVALISETLGNPPQEVMKTVSVEFARDFLRIKAPPLVKAELLARKDSFLAAVRSLLPNRTIAGLQ